MMLHVLNYPSYPYKKGTVCPKIETERGYREQRSTKNYSVMKTSTFVIYWEDAWRALQVALKRMWFTSTKQPKSWEFWAELWCFGSEKKKGFLSKRGGSGWMGSWRQRGWMRCFYLLAKGVYIYIADMMLWCFVCQSILHESYHKYCFVSCSLLGLLLQLEWHFLTTFPLPFWSLAQEIFSTQPMAFKKSWALATLS